MQNRNIRLRIAYDGTDFCGWQIQDGQRTVQGEMEQALDIIHEHPVRLRAAGRTDSGVHAHGQVANFVTDSSIPTERIWKALNSRLPRDIRVYSSEEVPESFHSRYDARWRVYKYFIHISEYSDPFTRRFCLTLKRGPDMTILNRHAADLIGAHDFTTFSATGDQSESRVREIRSAVFYRERQFLVFRIVGNAFLWRMVRSVVGTVLEVEEAGHPVGYLRELIESRDRSRAGSTAAAKGLTLFRVVYND